MIGTYADFLREAAKRLEDLREDTPRNLPVSPEVLRAAADRWEATGVEDFEMKKHAEFILGEALMPDLGQRQ